MRRTHRAVGFLLMAAAIVGLALVDRAPGPTPVAIAQEVSGRLLAAGRAGVARWCGGGGAPETAWREIWPGVHKGVQPEAPVTALQ